MHMYLFMQTAIIMVNSLIKEAFMVFGKVGFLNCSQKKNGIFLSAKLII